MPKELRFHQTIHVKQRVIERSLSWETIKAVIRAPDKKIRLSKGPHGGFKEKFSKTVDSRTMVVVAEIKADECWLITSYYAD